ncbi:MAG: AzlC family ABC transporter permease [Pseudomonadota bacterium]
MTRPIEDAIKAGIPIFIGYFPAAMAFGILAKGCGLALFESVLFSAVVFAGASQFIALNLLMTGMGPGGIILTTLLVNFRHFLMSASLYNRLKQISRRYLAVIAFGVTDEVFSVLSFKKGEISKGYVLALQFSAYSGWVSGTVLGYITGGFLSEMVSKSMGVALYALLLAILLPEIKRSMASWLLAVTSGVLNAILIWMDILPKGWSIIVCIVVIAFIGSFLIAPPMEE